MTINPDEIDLIPYIGLLVRNWWKVLLPAVIAAGIAVVLNPKPQVVYTASGYIILTSKLPTLSLAEQFPTIDQTSQSRNTMGTLTFIATSDEIALDTFDTLKDRIPEDEWTYETVQDSVSVESDGDILIITASSTSPDATIEIANEWTKNATDKINLIYSGEQSINEIQKQLENAYQDYLNAQSELEKFLIENEIGLLETQILESKKQLTSLNHQNTQQLEYYYGRKQNLEYELDQLSLLKKQLEDGNRSKAGELGDALAVLMARGNYESNIYQNVDDESRQIIYYGDSVDPAFRDVDIDKVLDNSSNYVNDIEALIELIEEEYKIVENEINSLTGEIVQPENSQDIKSLAEKISIMESEFEKGSARKNELTSQRDLTWNAYQAYAQKEAELRNAPKVDNMVSIAGIAVTPNESRPSGSIGKVLISFIFGAFIGVLWVFGEYWWKTNKAEL